MLEFLNLVTFHEIFKILIRISVAQGQFKGTEEALTARMLLFRKEINALAAYWAKEEQEIARFGFLH